MGRIIKIPDVLYNSGFLTGNPAGDPSTWIALCFNTISQNTTPSVSYYTSGNTPSNQLATLANSQYVGGAFQLGNYSSNQYIFDSSGLLGVYVDADNNITLDYYTNPLNPDIANLTLVGTITVPGFIEFLTLYPNSSQVQLRGNTNYQLRFTPIQTS